MNKKICHRCHKDSYSSMHKGKWLCPHCGADLTDNSIEPYSGERAGPESMDVTAGKKHGHLWLIKGRQQSDCE